MLLYLKVKSNKAASLTESSSFVLVLLLLQNEGDVELSEEQKIEVLESFGDDSLEEVFLELEGEVC